MRKVAVLVQDGVEPFGLGAMCEVWAEPYHPEDDNPVFDFVVAHPPPRPGPRPVGLRPARRARPRGRGRRRPGLRGPQARLPRPLARGRGRGRRAPTRAAPSSSPTAPPPSCSGEAGLLDGRRCTTHWRHVDVLAERFPRALVDENVLYVQDGTIVTGAGSAAGLDAALHLLRQQFGARVAAAGRAPDGDPAAPLRRPGPVHRPPRPRLRRRDPRPAAGLDPREPRRRPRRRRAGPPQPHVAADLRPPVPRRDRHHPAQLGHRASGCRPPRSCSSSPTTRSTGSPSEVGFGNAAALRHHFSRARGVSPQQYRRTFTGRRAPDRSRAGRAAPCRSGSGAARRGTARSWAAWAATSRSRAYAASSASLAVPTTAAQTRWPHVVVGRGVDRDVLDARVLAQGVLDLERVDVDAAADDQVLAAAVEVEVAVLVEPAEVADRERALPVRRSRHAAAVLPGSP